MVSIYSFLQDLFTGDYAVSQMLSAFLFLFLVVTSVGLVKYYIPDKIDKSFKIIALLSGILFVSYFSYFCMILKDTDLLLGLIISLSLASCLFHPSMALSNLIGYLILRPWELLENEELAILPRTLLVLFLVSLILNYFQKNRLKINTSNEQLLIIGLGIWVFISTLLSGDAVESQNLFFEGYLKSIIVAIFIFQTIKTDDDYNMISNTIVMAVLGVSIFALVNTYFIANADRLEGRGAVQNANDLAALLIFILPLSLRAIFKKELNLTGLFVSATIMIILILGVWKAQSRASYLSIMLMGMTFFVYHFRHRKKILLQLGTVAVVGFLALSQLSLGRDSTDLDESKMNRLGYWKAGISMAVRHPMLGVGFSQFPNNYQYYGAADFTEHGKRTAHSSWILLLSEAGFPALLLLLALMYQAAFKAWSVFQSAPELLLMLVGYGVCMTFLSHTYAIYPYILLGLIFTYPRVQNENSVA